MANRVEQEDIVKINELYLDIGTYAGVARKVGFSASTVKKYVQEGYVSPNTIETQRFDADAIIVEDLKFPSVWDEFLSLSTSEKAEILDLQKEVAI